MQKSNCDHPLGAAQNRNRGTHRPRGNGEDRILIHEFYGIILGQYLANVTSPRRCRTGNRGGIRFNAKPVEELSMRFCPVPGP